MCSLSAFKESWESTHDYIRESWLKTERREVNPVHYNIKMDWNKTYIPAI